MLRIDDSGRYIGSRIGLKTGTAAAREDRDGVVRVVVVVMRGCPGGAGIQSACNTGCTTTLNDMALRRSFSVVVALLLLWSASSTVSSRSNLSQPNRSYPSLYLSFTFLTASQTLHRPCPPPSSPRTCLSRNLRSRVDTSSKTAFPSRAELWTRFPWQQETVKFTIWGLPSSSESKCECWGHGKEGQPPLVVGMWHDERYIVESVDATSNSCFVYGAGSVVGRSSWSVSRSSSS